MGLKRWVWISLISILLILATVIFIAGYNKQQTNQFIAQQDTSLVQYDYAKDLATQSLSVISVGTQADYNILRDKFKPLWSQDLWDEYFNTVNYQGGNKNFTLTVQSTEGEEIADNKYLFKIEAVMHAGVVDTPVVMLYTIDHGILVNIESLL